MSFKGVSDEGKRLYAEMKNKHAYRYLILKLNGADVIVEKSAPPSATYSDFLKDLPDDCRWIVYDLEFDIGNGQKHSKITFIVWAPDKAPLRSKMQLSTWTTQVTRSFETGGITNIVQATDRSEIDHATVVEKVTRRMKLTEALYNCIARRDVATAVKIIKSSAAQINLSDEFRGWNILEQATYEGLFEVVDMLLSSRASKTLKPAQLHRTLLSAVRQGHGAIIERLIRHGVDVNAQDEQDGESAFHAAAHSGKIVAMQLLLDAGADVNLRDMRMQTPLHYAIQIVHWLPQHLPGVYFLVSNGADLSAKDVRGMRPVDIARECRLATCIPLLITQKIP